MPLNVRLTAREERALAAAAKRRGLSRSDVVREALAQYDAAGTTPATAPQPFEAWRDVVGIVDLGVRDPARTTGEQVADLLRQRRARRSR